MCRHLAVVATCRRHVGNFLSQGGWRRGAVPLPGVVPPRPDGMSTFVVAVIGNVINVIEVGGRGRRDGSGQMLRPRPQRALQVEAQGVRDQGQGGVLPDDFECRYNGGGVATAMATLRITVTEPEGGQLRRWRQPFVFTTTS